MEAVAVTLQLTPKTGGPELQLTVGRTIAVRIVEPPPAGSARGLISLAGQLIEAKLPQGVQPGQQMKLVVREIAADRVVLSASHEVSETTEVPIAAVPLPGGGTVAVTEKEQGQSGGGRESAARHSVSLRYQSPVLGAIDLRFDLADKGLAVIVAAGAGEAHEYAQDGAAQLTRTLEGATNRSVSVTVQARRDPVNLYA